MSPEVAQNVLIAAIVAVGLFTGWRLLGGIERSQTNEAAAARIAALLVLVSSAIAAIWFISVREVNVPSNGSHAGEQWLYIPADPSKPNGAHWIVRPEDPRFDELVAQGRGTLGPAPSGVE